MNLIFTFFVFVEVPNLLMHPGILTSLEMLSKNSYYNEFPDQYFLILKIYQIN